MVKPLSPLHAKRLPKTVTNPAEIAVAATAPENVPAPLLGRATKKMKPAQSVVEAEGLGKPPKTHKAKLVRDSFTIPKDEYQSFEALKSRALGLEVHVRKSELLRAGIQALRGMSDRAFLKAVGNVPTLKTGRPKSD